MKQAEILIIGVIYNTWPETLRYLKSIADAEIEKTEVILADNSNLETPADFLTKISNYPFVHYHRTGKNTGYFGGAREGLKFYLNEHKSYPDWVLVTNVDIVFTPHFFQQLSKISNQQNLGAVAPSIISKRWNADYNPKILTRYTKNKLRFYQFLYSSFLIHNAFLILAYLKKWLIGRRRKNTNPGDHPSDLQTKIYAPHGSCLVFHRNYFTQGGNLDLPNFLFGEEVLVAENALKTGLDIVYHPEMVIYDYEHASTGFFVTPTINNYNKQAIQSIISSYYN